jgi:sigma54-dependent transcription regulator
MHILLSWIGHADLRAMAAEQPPELQQKIRDVTGMVGPLQGGRGPVRTLVETVVFDQICLLSNYSKDITKLFLDWLGQTAEARYTALPNPTDYGAIFATVDKEMQAIVHALAGKAYEFSILLSPGTPAMAAIWVLLGKTKYPARFYQTHAGKAWVTDIPFDLTVDVVPELLRGADSIFQHLTTHRPQELQGFERIVGDSQSMRLAVGRARTAALRDVPVLLLGESGTGKEMFARALHDASHRHSKPFLVINCAAIPKPLLESELFGHEKQIELIRWDQKYLHNRFVLTEYGGLMFATGLDGHCEDHGR